MLVVALYAVPTVVGVYLSTRSRSIGSFAPDRFVGFGNYRRDVTTATFRESVRTTVVIAALGLAVQLPAGLGLAAILHRNLRGTRLFRSILLLPMLLTPVAIGLTWRFMLDTDLGVVNWLLRSLGLGGFDWLGNRRAAVAAIVIVDSWQSIPFVMLLAVAGLAGLPVEPQEAARVDGAGSLRVFWSVTMPMLRRVLAVILLIRLIDVLKLFDVIFLLTRGGPGTATQTVGLLTYNTGFNFLQTSRAAAIGVAVTILMLPLFALWRSASRGGR
jgi:multiple sugar transport system permease protein